LALLKIDKINTSLTSNIKSFKFGIIDNDKADIYSGEEIIRFNNRHPIFKTLMKLEFEDVIRSFPKKYF